MYVARSPGVALYLTACIRIHAHGGKYVQFARDDPELLVVYGGQTTRMSYMQYPARGSITTGFSAYDIKLIMNKDICDIIRPQWILDCVAQGEIVPLTKKCVPQLDLILV